MNDRLPPWMREGYQRNGPRRISCPYCKRSLSSNALARASHSRSKAHNDAYDAYLRSLQRLGKRRTE